MTRSEDLVMAFAVGLALILAGGMSPALARHSARARRDLLHRLLVVSGCAVASFAAARVLTAGVPQSFALPSAMPGGEWVFGHRSARRRLFLVVLGVGAMCALFGTDDLALDASGNPATVPHAAWFTQLAFAVL